MRGLLASLVVLGTLTATAFADRAMPREMPAPSTPASGETVANLGPPRPIVRPSLGPAAETAALGKELTGTWTCQGERAETRKIAVALDGAWIKIVTTSDKDVTRIEHRTYDPIAKLWTAIVLEPSGATVLTSLGDDKGAWTWTGAAGIPSRHELRTKTGFTTWLETTGKLKIAETTCALAAKK
jgi:hypothetical protein